MTSSITSPRTAPRMMAIGLEYVVHLLGHDLQAQRLQSVVRVTPRSKHDGLGKLKQRLDAIAGIDDRGRRGRVRVYVHHQSRHACRTPFARLTAVTQRKIYGWKSLGSHVNGVTTIIVIRSLPEI